MDFRTGGAYRFVMRAPDGQDNPFHGVYREIVRNERIVFTPSWTTSPATSC